MDELERQEYKTLRATIRERGTVRAITFLAAMIAWAALFLLAVITHAAPSLALLAPLVVLVAGFEVAFQLYLGVERVGRYIQAGYEERRAAGSRSAAETGEAVTPGWETVAMAYGNSYPGSGSDALFAAVFAIAALVNALPAVASVVVAPSSGSFGAHPIALSLAVVLAHVPFFIRIIVARGRARRQRAEDLERFRALVRRAR